MLGAFYLGRQTKSLPSSGCTMEAKVCPDGSAVGRSGPKCEFAPCPEVTTVPLMVDNDTSDWKTYTNSKLNFSFKYPADLSLSANQKVPDNYTIKNSSTFIAFNIQSTCLNTQCLSIQSLDEIANNMLSLDVLSSFRIGSSKGIKITNGFMVEIPNSNNFLLLNSGQNTPIVDQILSTFKFTETKAIKSIKYDLPANWLSVRDNSQLFEVGYNPATQDIKMDKQSISIIYKNLNNNPYYSNYASSQLFQILPYNNGSRHAFIEKQLGETINSGNKFPDYFESDINIDGKSCLVLHGISISQFYPIWGMCAINSQQALLFNSFNYADLSPHLSSLKFTP
ncbi:MAG: hypothetical protein WAV41_05865 [Microgenomates group bacterium]